MVFVPLPEGMTQFSYFVMFSGSRFPTKLNHRVNRWLCNVAPNSQEMIHWRYVVQIERMFSEANNALTNQKKVILHKNLLSPTILVEDRWPCSISIYKRVYPLNNLDGNGPWFILGVAN